MEFSIAVQIAAITAPVATAALVAWFTTGRAHALTREERVQSRRAEAYIELADLIVRIRQYAATAFPGVDDDSPLRAPPMDEDQRWRVLALAQAYGSQEVIERYDELLSEVTRVRSAVSHAEDVRSWSHPYTEAENQERIRSAEELRTRRAALTAACESLLEQLNGELMGNGRGPRPGLPLLIGTALVIALAAGTVGYVLADPAPGDQPAADNATP